MDYIHTVQYYETDKMGITHHSNYIRWMEEARIDFLSRIGWDYARLEDAGIMSPVLRVSCDYKRPTTFSDKVSIHISVKEFTGVRMNLAYEMKAQDGNTVCLATSSHAFVNPDGRPIRLRRENPELFATLKKLAEEDLD